MKLIECNDLCLGYESKEILHSLNFEVNAGDHLCIVGENGSGKSTLMKALLGLIPPMGGEIIFGGELDADEIGYLPQQTPIQRDFPASVEEIVLSGCQGRCGMRPFYTKSDRESARRNLARMNMSEFARRPYRELSGGQQQRVLLARALCATRKLLLLDEPVSGLDAKTSNLLYSLIDGLNKNDGITVIMITHDLDAAMSYASHVLHIGKKVFFGTRDEYAEHLRGTGEEDGSDE